MIAIDRVDVCVVGGGPAGSTIAQRLASLGHEVLLAEASAFPRAHVDASLPPSIWPLLDAIGVAERVVDAGFIPASLPVVNWPEARPEMASDGPTGGLHVERSHLDAILLDAALRAGVRVLQPARATRPTRIGDSGWRTTLHLGSGRQEVMSEIVVDATGGRLLPGRQTRLGPPTLALHARWRHELQTLPRSMVEARPEEWLWCAPVTRSEVIAAAFLDPKRLTRKDREAIRRVYLDVLLGSRAIRTALADAVPGPVHVCDATSRAAQAHSGDGFVRVGDASIALDPLSSQGVQVAMASAVQAAVVVNTMLRRPSSATAAVEFYAARQIERMERHRDKASRLYAEVASRHVTGFWRNRSAGHVATPIESLPACGPMPVDQPVKMAPGTAFEVTPAIEGELIVERRALQPPGERRLVAYVGPVEIAKLLEATVLDRSPTSIVADWSRSLPVDLCWSLMQWLWERGVVIAAECAAAGRSG